MTEVLIKSRGGEEGRDDILPLTSVPLSLSPPVCLAASLEGRATKASCFNEEKCINLVLAWAQIERRAGEGALSESFFLIKDSIEEDCALSLVPSVESAAFLPVAPSGPRGGFSLPSVSPHQQSSRGGQVLPPDAAFNAIPLSVSPPALK